MMNLDVEEMPIDHNKESLTNDDIQVIKNYRKNDVLSTLGLLYLTLGDTESLKKLSYSMTGIDTDLEELKNYQGKNKIQDRFDVIEETGLQCLNWADVTIGEEWNKINYINKENIKEINSIYPKKVIYPFGKKFKNYFPSSMDFKTEYMKNIISEIGEKYVKNMEQEFPIKIGGHTHIFAKGGLHISSAHRILKRPEGYILRDADVGGQYPNFIIKSKIYSPHLKESIIKIAQENVDKRTKYKKLSKDSSIEKDVSRKYMGLQEMLKLCNNGGDPHYNKTLFSIIKII